MQSRRTQRATRLAALAALGVSGVLFAQALGLKPGLYEFTITADVQLPPDVAAKLPPQALAMLQKPNVTQHCVTQGDLDHFSQDIAQGNRSNQAQSCKLTEHSISGSTVKWTTQCEHSLARFEGTFAGDSFQGSMASTGDKGQVVTARIAAHRVGDCK